MGLILAQVIYVVVFMVEPFHLAGEAAIMLGVLGLIDVVMIANLLIMVIIGISSIHLLKTFIEVGDLGTTGAASDNVTGDNYTDDGVLWQVMIHVVFIGSAIALAWIDRTSSGTHAGPASAPAVERMCRIDGGYSMPVGDEVRSDIYDYLVEACGMAG